MRYLILIGCILTSCATSQPEVFRLSTGELVTCQRYAQRDCGMNIMQCSQGSDVGTVEFDCLQDVHYVGKIGVAPQKPAPKVPADYAPEAQK